MPHCWKSCVVAQNVCYMFPIISDIIDPAVMRPGRLDKTLYVGLPSVDDRLDILKCITQVITVNLVNSKFFRTIGFILNY